MPSKISEKTSISLKLVMALLIISFFLGAFQFQITSNAMAIEENKKISSHIIDIKQSLGKLQGKIEALFTFLKSERGR